ncbi:MAG: hypothetical protein QF535_04930 [Anaerolineales bacterium]|nr:hypothetical protein [Anaerolineales bacterium]
MSNGNQLGKSLSVGHIVATVGLIIGGFTFIYDLRESVAIQAFQLENVETRLERVVARTDDQFGEIMDHLIRLEEKLDAIVLPSTTYQRPR